MFASIIRSALIICSINRSTLFRCCCCNQRLLIKLLSSSIAHTDARPAVAAYRSNAFIAVVADAEPLRRIDRCRRSADPSGPMEIAHQQADRRKSLVVIVVDIVVVSLLLLLLLLIDPLVLLLIRRNMKTMTNQSVLLIAAC